MVSELTNEINEVNELGLKMNPKFDTLFHIDKLNDNEKIYVYKENNEVIGFVHIAVNYEIADILNIFVKEEYRHKHIAMLILDYMLGELPKTVTKMMLEVRASNKAAISLYYKFNFEDISIRRNYYDGEDAIVMERIIR